MRRGFHTLGAVTSEAALAQSVLFFPFERQSSVVPLNGSPLVGFPGETLVNSFTLLDPSYLYGLDDLRFYRLRSPLTKTALPALLVDGPGNPSGDFHAIRVLP